MASAALRPEGVISAPRFLRRRSPENVPITLRADTGKYHIPLPPNLSTDKRIHTQPFSYGWKISPRPSFPKRGTNRFPLWKRGIKGDFINNTTFCLMISPRITEWLHPHHVTLGDCQDAGAAELALLEELEGVIGLFKGEDADLGSDRDIRCQEQEVAHILPGAVGHAPDSPLLVQ